MREVACVLSDVEVDLDIVVLVWVILTSIIGSIYNGVLRVVDPIYASLLVPPVLVVSLLLFCNDLLRCTCLAVLLQGGLFWQ